MLLSRLFRGLLTAPLFLSTWPGAATGARRATLAPALAAIALCALMLPVRAADPPPVNDGAQVLQSFQKEAAAAPAPDGSDQTRRWVMFALGAPLLVFILITAGLGIAMGVYGKPVFVAHMIFAGLSVTLAIVHAIVGLVWFRPF
jgi:hypothetical protein